MNRTGLWWHINPILYFLPVSSNFKVPISTFRNQLHQENWKKVLNTYRYDIKQERERWRYQKATGTPKVLLGCHWENMCNFTTCFRNSYDVRGWKKHHLRVFGILDDANVKKWNAATLKWKHEDLFHDKARSIPTWPGRDIFIFVPRTTNNIQTNTTINTTQ